MTREIKFRAWDKELKTMTPLDGMWICNEYSSLCFGSTQKEYSGICEWPKGSYNKDNQIIMQYTGLKDKNGKEIYEGDITKEGGIVEWGDEEAAFVVSEKNNRDIKNHLWTQMRIPVEIIGNIYENPELLASSKTE